MCVCVVWACWAPALNASSVLFITLGTGGKVLEGCSVQSRKLGPQLGWVPLSLPPGIMLVSSSSSS